MKAPSLRGFYRISGDLKWSKEKWNTIKEKNGIPNAF